MDSCVDSILWSRSMWSTVAAWSMRRGPGGGLLVYWVWLLPWCTESTAFVSDHRTLHAQIASIKVTDPGQIILMVSCKILTHRPTVIKHVEWIFISLGNYEKKHCPSKEWVKPVHILLKYFTPIYDTNASCRPTAIH